MANGYPFNTPLTPLDWYCRKDSTMCIKNWAGMLVLEYRPEAHARFQQLMPRLAALYGVNQILFILTDYNANRQPINYVTGVYYRVFTQGAHVTVDFGLPTYPPYGTDVRQIIFLSLPYRRELREILDTV